MAKRKRGTKLHTYKAIIARKKRYARRKGLKGKAAGSYIYGGRNRKFIKKRH